MKQNDSFFEVDMLEIAKQYGKSFVEVGVLEAINGDESSPEDAAHGQDANRETGLEAVKQNGSLLQHAAPGQRVSGSPLQAMFQKGFASRGDAPEFISSTSEAMQIEYAPAQTVAGRRAQTSRRLLRRITAAWHKQAAMLQGEQTFEWPNFSQQRYGQ